MTEKKECHSSIINEDGYSYKINGQLIEIYEVEPIKTNSLIDKKEGELEVTIKSESGILRRAICIDNTFIFNAAGKLKQDIIKILEQK